ncbi:MULTISPECIES: DUF937 domain-containing protein [unclassified Mesorhizobium]|uniref:DUF937 domain-containing protein n=2 Tax=Mesorhizobium TaxID=68287 RepID=UPI000F760318|nr:MULTISPECIES: DUF937 domain-containing protein [unclassified Mesorhizobium]AZO05682.1 DUF937 domain-containing protein [Mesorhizobium sp. M2A.F.Ca.ET.043.02.1.1]RUW41953.1 DUF937 domain-containing protein [Mesorhizobium sp. M2A.F.Ca.ET.015.02.1.1]RUW72163.1 DUF937 domain-containing protein [Mesorhizobium sp. M2A.F.Ca.ET.067.02.1.1]RVC92366.1 DUF937 domain-containing protein [Mesorhizobium sp. M2A.F.Ca.ET.017.03.2.1]RWB48992.1 MAG: DUF937 domain-containing protein [Mesorhizobium sp.]
MPSLFDIFAQAQNGAGMQALAQQYGLSMQQTQAAVQALLPAFSQGLQRNTADPYGMGAFMTAMASGQHAKYFEDATRAFSPQGIDEGNGILGHLFGSKELSRAVANQAAQATGLSQQVLQQMLPAMASMMMGGLFKQTNNQLTGGQMQAFGGSGNPLGEIIEQMMRQGGLAPAPQTRQAPAPNPYGENPLGKVLQDMFGGGAAQPQSQTQQAPNPYGENPLGKVLQDMFGGSAQPQSQPQQTQSPYGDNPLGKIFEEMLRQGGGGFGAPGGQPAPQPQQRQPQQSAPQQPQANPSGRPRNPFDDIFGKMFETGAQQRDEYQKGVETIFDQFKRDMDRR